MSPVGPYFHLNSPNNFSANRSVVDSNHCTLSCIYVLEKNIRRSRVLNNQLGSCVFERRNSVNRREFLGNLPSHATRPPRACLGFAPVRPCSSLLTSCGHQIIFLLKMVHTVTNFKLSGKFVLNHLKKREYFKAFSVINQRYFISHATSYKALKFSTVLV